MATPLTETHTSGGGDHPPCYCRTRRADPRRSQDEMGYNHPRSSIFGSPLPGTEHMGRPGPTGARSIMAVSASVDILSGPR